MLRHVFSSRTTLAALVFFMLVVGGSLLYSWHILRTTESDLEQGHQILQQPENSESKTDTPIGQAAPIENAIRVKQRTNTTDATDTVLDQTKTITDRPQDKSLAETSVTEIEAEIIAEEEKAEAALSAEKLRIQELKKRKNSLLAEMNVLMESEGGAITPNSRPDVRQESTRILKELADIQQEIDGAPNPTLNHFVTLTQMMNNALNDKGEIRTADYAKIASYIETTGDVELANDIRAIVQKAIDNGDEVIKSEHLNLLKK